MITAESIDAAGLINKVLLSAVLAITGGDFSQESLDYVYWSFVGSEHDQFEELWKTLTNCESAGE